MSGPITTSILERFFRLVAFRGRLAAFNHPSSSRVPLTRSLTLKNLCRSGLESRNRLLLLCATFLISLSQAHAVVEEPGSASTWLYYDTATGTLSTTEAAAWGTYLAALNDGYICDFRRPPPGDTARSPACQAPPASKRRIPVRPKIAFSSRQTLRPESLVCRETHLAIGTISGEPVNLNMDEGIEAASHPVRPLLNH